MILFGESATNGLWNRICSAVHYCVYSHMLGMLMRSEKELYSRRCLKRIFKLCLFNYNFRKITTNFNHQNFVTSVRHIRNNLQIIFHFAITFVAVKLLKHTTLFKSPYSLTYLVIIYFTKVSSYTEIVSCKYSICIFS